MTNYQLYFAIGLPLLAVFTSLIISLIQISAIRDDVRGLRNDTRIDMSEIRSDIREIRNDIKILNGKVYELMQH